MRTSCSFPVALMVIFGLWGCQSSTPTPNPKTQTTTKKTVKGEPSPTTSKPKKSPHDTLLAAVAKVRDRPWKTKPTLKGVSASVLPTPRSKKTPQDAERVHLSRMLFGDASRLSFLKWPTHQLARSTSTKTIEYAADHKDKDALQRALFFACVETLDAQYNGPRPAAKSWDQQQAYTLADLASPMFALGLHELQQKYPKLDAKSLAQRPELIFQHGWFGKQLQLPAIATKWDETQRASSAILGFGLASAMYRAQGWSGIELLSNQRPNATRQIAQPATWMGGQAVPTWTWPVAWMRKMRGDGWYIEQRGRVGDLIFSYWLRHGNQMVGKNLAFLSQGIRADRYLSLRQGDKSVLIWLIQWDKPHVAAEAEKLFRQMSKRGFTAVSSFESSREGLLTALVFNPKNAKLPSMKDVLKTRVAYRSTPYFPVKYTASQLDRVVQGATISALDKKKLWKDPALGIQVNLGILPATWVVQLNRRGPLRWYARTKTDMIQLAVDLFDPLGISFDDKGYQQKLKKALSAGLDSPKVIAFKAFKHPLGPGYEMSMTAKVKGKLKHWSIWHINHDGILLTLSSAADEKTQASASQLASKLVAGLKTTLFQKRKTTPLKYKVEP